MAGGFAAPAGGAKIKGGRWTVFRFFLVSTAFTSTWVAVSSQLGYYRQIHGPAVLLQLNIAYFLPSIPLLVASAFLDRPLEARLGVARTILVRLLLGLLGYGAVTAWFPFMPDHIWFLLGAVVALGLFSGIAFSASYQLVARFANKNVIALGLGCSASGPLVLAMQLALGMKSTPTRNQQILLFEGIALVVVGGLWATASLLVRHWGAIERAAGSAAKQGELSEPLLQQQAAADDGEGETELAAAAAGGAGASTPAARQAAAAEEGEAAPLTPAGLRQASWGPFLMPPFPHSQGHTPGQQQQQQQQHGGVLGLGGSLWKQRSLPPLVAYSSLEPYQSPFLSTDQEVGDAAFHHQPSPSSWNQPSLLACSEDEEEGGLSGGRGREAARAAHQRSERQLSAPPAVLPPAAAPDGQGAEAGSGEGFDGGVDVEAAVALLGRKAGPEDSAAGGDAASSIAPAADGPSGAAGGQQAAAGDAGSGGSKPGGGGGASASWQAVCLIWAPLLALSLSSTIALTLFPFFTYVPTSGLLGDTLPKVLFYVRIFADVLGRFLPRLSPLAAKSPLTPLVAAGCKLAGVPIFLLYLKSPDRIHSDVAAVLFICVIWVLGGYVNTMSNMMAPRLVPAHLKGSAAGAMAIAYQVAHLLGLSLATLLVFLMYGHIGVED